MLIPTYVPRFVAEYSRPSCERVPSAGGRAGGDPECGFSSSTSVSSRCSQRPCGLDWRTLAALACTDKKQGLADIARNVIDTHFEPSFLS